MTRQALAVIVGITFFFVTKMTRRDDLFTDALTETFVKDEVFAAKAVLQALTLDLVFVVDDAAF